MRLDADAKQRRAQVEEDFEIAMASRRTESMRALAEQEATSKAEAERRVREATEEATKRITHAAQRVSALRQLRTKVADQLNAARDLIADAHLSLEKAAPALDPLPDERPAPQPPKSESQTVEVPAPDKVDAPTKVF